MLTVFESVEFQTMYSTVGLHFWGLTCMRAMAGCSAEQLTSFLSSQKALPAV